MYDVAGVVAMAAAAAVAAGGVLLIGYNAATGVEPGAAARCGTEK